MCVTKFRGQRFLVCRYQFTDVSNALSVIARPQNMAVAISDVTIEIAALGYASLAMTIAGNFLSKILLCTATTPTDSAAETHSSLPVCLAGAKQVNEMRIKNEPATNNVIRRRGSLHLVSHSGSIGPVDWSLWFFVNAS